MPVFAQKEMPNLMCRQATKKDRQIDLCIDCRACQAYCGVIVNTREYRSVCKSEYTVRKAVAQRPLQNAKTYLPGSGFVSASQRRSCELLDWALGPGNMNPAFGEYPLGLPFRTVKEFGSGF